MKAISMESIEKLQVLNNTLETLINMYFSFREINSHDYAKKMLDNLENVMDEATKRMLEELKSF